MQRIGFKMKMHKDCAAEYKHRHETIWPEMKALLHAKGIRDYSIFLDEDSGDLFGTLKIHDAEVLNDLAAEPLMKRWWTYMKDIMDTNADESPLNLPLKEVFYLP